MNISIRCAGHNPQGKAFFYLAGKFVHNPLLPERAFFFSLPVLYWVQNAG